MVLDTAVSMGGLRPSGVSQPRISCRSWKWVSKVSRRRYDRVLGGAAQNYSQGLTKTPGFELIVNAYAGLGAAAPSRGPQGVRQAR